MSRYKPQGWRNESQRHSLARKGIKTGSKSRSYKVVGAKGINLIDTRLYKFGTVAWQDAMVNNVLQKKRHGEELSSQEILFVRMQKERGERVLGAKGRYTAREIIKRAVGNSKNFMTPNIIRYGKINPETAYELSSGESMVEGQTIYGVTVSSIDRQTGKTKREFDLSKSFFSREKAESYIEGLKG